MTDEYVVLNLNTTECLRPDGGSAVQKTKKKTPESTRVHVQVCDESRRYFGGTLE